MQIEEKDLPTLDGSVLPAEGARVANCHIDSGPGLNPSAHKVTFFTMPEGVRGKWHTWDEWVELRCCVVLIVEVFEIFLSWEVTG